MRGTDLSELLAFVTVAEEKSFRRAAAKLGVTPSTLSHSLRGLEERLGIRLLNRTTRKVSPTEAGEHLQRQLPAAFADIAMALESLNAFRDTPRGTVRINAPRTAIHLVVVPRLAQLASDYPDIQLELVAQEGFVDIVEQGFDAGIRLGEDLHGDMRSVRVSQDLKLAIVAAPRYLARHPRPRTPQDLLAHRCIGWRQVASGELYRWPFQKGPDVIEVAVQGPLVLDDADLMVRAAIAGTGIAFALEEQVADDIASGRLERLLEDWCAPFAGFFLYYPNRRHHSAALTAVMNVLRLREPPPTHSA